MTMNRCAIAIAATLLALPAAAQELNIPGDLGNEGGCVRSKGGATSTDDVLLIRKTEVEQYESGCEYIEVTQSKMGPQVVRALCAGEGSYWPMEFVLADVGEGNFGVSFADGRPEVMVRLCE